MKEPVRRIALVAIVAFAISIASADAQPWRLEKNQDGVRMYSRAVEHWSIREIRGLVQIEAPLSSVVAVLTDIEAGHALSDVIVQEEIVQRTDDRHYRFHSVLDLPWPVSDRDAVYQRSIEQDERTLTVTITDEALADSEVPVGRGRVRMLKSHQTWLLTPEASGVAVELRILADPNGPIPAPIINAMSIGTPFETLVRLRTMARMPRYAGANIAFIRDPGRATTN